jgi:hypothetical protein
MISRSTLEAANRVAEYVARRPIVLELSALSTPPAVDEPKPEAAGMKTLASGLAPANKRSALSDDAD